MLGRATLPYGDTRQPSSPWFALACEARDCLFPVQAIAGHTKQCDSCQGWPFLEAEPQTTHLRIETKNATGTPLRVVVLEHYWECGPCMAGRAPVKCDWCCQEFPDMVHCNTSAHNNPELWGLEAREGDPPVEEWAAGGLTCVKHLAIGCRTRWSDSTHPADKVVESACPSCHQTVVFDRTEKFRTYVLSTHPRKCLGMPKHWQDLANSESRIRKVFEEGNKGSRGRRLMVYKERAKQAITFVKARFTEEERRENGMVDSEESNSWKLDDAAERATALTLPTAAGTETPRTGKLAVETSTRPETRRTTAGVRTTAGATVQHGPALGAAGLGGAIVKREEWTGGELIVGAARGSGPMIMTGAKGLTGKGQTGVGLLMGVTRAGHAVMEQFSEEHGLVHEDDQGLFADSLPALEHHPCHQEIDVEWLTPEDKQVEDPELAWGLRRTAAVMHSVPAATLISPKRPLNALLEDESAGTVVLALDGPFDAPGPSSHKRVRHTLSSERIKVPHNGSVYPLRKSAKSQCHVGEVACLPAAVPVLEGKDEQILPSHDCAAAIHELCDSPETELQQLRERLQLVERRNQELEQQVARVERESRQRHDACTRLRKMIVLVKPLIVALDGGLGAGQGAVHDGG